MLTHRNNIEILITDLSVLNQTKLVIPVAFFCKIKNKNVFPLANSIVSKLIDVSNMFQSSSRGNPGLCSVTFNLVQVLTLNSRCTYNAFICWYSLI